MKEAMWGVLIVVLGLFGIVVVNLFQNVTVDNDRVYYLIKESTEAAAYDAIDLQYYRTTGNMKIAEDKFIENLTRRFAQNVTVGDYKIIVEDLNEVPPKISLRIRSGVTSLRGEEFGLVNRVDGVIETKYSIDEVLDFLCEDKTTEECNTIREEFGVKVEIDSSSGENRCSTDISDEDMDCIPGDLKFIGWGDSNLPIGICQDESAPRDKERTAKYAICECGKWSDENTKTVTANPVSSGNEYIYTWTFSESTDVRTINESVKERVRKQVCTTDIKVLVPENPNELIPKNNPNEPSADNSSYVLCPAEGIKIPSGTKVTLHPQYVPANAANRKLEWTSSDTSVLTIQSSNPYETCELNSTNTNCLSKAVITAQNITGSKDVTIKVKTTRGQTATCKVTVWDGIPETLGCKDLEIEYNAEGQMEKVYTPKNSTKTDAKWSLSDTTYATINEETGEVKGNNGLSPIDQAITVTIESKTDSAKTGTCTLKVKGKACPTSYPHISEEDGKNATSCPSPNQIKQTSNNGEGCYNVTCVCSGEYPYSSNETAKSAASCSDGKVASAEGDGQGCYKSSCVTPNSGPDPGPYTVTTPAGTCSVKYNEEWKAPDRIDDFGEDESCEPKTCRAKLDNGICVAGSESVTSADLCGYASCNKCAPLSCRAAGANRCASCGCQIADNVDPNLCVLYNACATCGYKQDGAKCGYKSCSACGAATCTVCKMYKSGKLCGYKACAYSKIVKQYFKIVNYGGDKIITTTASKCTNTRNVRTITTRVICRITRDQYYDNPKPIYDDIISETVKTEQCPEFN